MKVIIPTTVEIDITHVVINVPVLYGEEDIPHDFPLRTDDRWVAPVEIDTGRILNWPEGREGKLHMKVCDSGRYILMGGGERIIATLDGEYVPHGLIPGSYGDYIELDIDATGTITNWPRKPRFGAFFDRD